VIRGIRYLAVEFKVKWNYLRMDHYIDYNSIIYLLLILLYSLFILTKGFETIRITQKSPTPIISSSLSSSVNAVNSVVNFYVLQHGFVGSSNDLSYLKDAIIKAGSARKDALYLAYCPSCNQGRKGRSGEGGEKNGAGNEGVGNEGDREDGGGGGCG